MVRADEAEAAVLHYIKELVNTAEFEALARGEIEDLLATDGQGAQTRLRAIEKQISRLERRLEWVIDQAAKNPKLRSKFRETCERYENRSADLRQEAEQLRQQTAQQEGRVRQANRIYELLVRFQPAWEALGDDEPRKVIALLLEKAAATSGEGEVIIYLKAHFLPEHEARIPALHWSKRPKTGPLSLTPRQCHGLTRNETQPI